MSEAKPSCLNVHTSSSCKIQFAITLHVQHEQDHNLAVPQDAMLQVSWGTYLWSRAHAKAL